jgi:DNA mismatch repair ATPase MutS
MLKEVYEKSKSTYKDYVVLLKSGNFYISFNKDAIIMNNIFNYQIKQVKDYIKIGFPIISINKIVNELTLRKVNYVIINNEIINKKKFSNNSYKKYLLEKENYEILLVRIKKINTILKNSLNNQNIKQVLDDIENVLCKISY